MIQVAFLRIARVVKWQTRTFEGRMPKGVGVQVPPRACICFIINDLQNFATSHILGFWQFGSTCGACHSTDKRLRSSSEALSIRRRMMVNTRREKISRSAAEAVGALLRCNVLVDNDLQQSSDFDETRRFRSIDLFLVREEEAAGSNPASPTTTWSCAG